MKEPWGKGHGFSKSFHHRGRTENLTIFFLKSGRWVTPSAVNVLLPRRLPGRFVNYQFPDYLITKFSMDTMGTWWGELSTVLKIYWGIAIPFSIFFLLQLVLSFMGAESPDDVPDAEIEADHGFAFQFLTLKNLVGFFTIFGWTGIACTEAGYSQGLTLLLASLAGLMMVGLMAGLFYLMTRGGADGTMKMSHAIGQVGEIYLAIPPKRSAMGKIQVNVDGSLRTLDAMTDDEQALATGQLAKVVEIVNQNILLVTSK